MTSHELARKLLELPDLPMAIRLYGHEYETEHNKYTHGHLGVEIIETPNGQHVRFGNRVGKK